MFFEVSDIYLKTPKTGVEEGSGHFIDFSYDHASMQGWRKGMEDAVICHPNLATGVHLFGVLDGHGGAEVSAVVSKRFPQVLGEQRSFREGNYEQALRDTFRLVDDWLRSQDGLKALVEEKLKMPFKELLKKKHYDKITRTLLEFGMYGKFEQIEKTLILFGNVLVEESGSTANIVLITPTRVYCANIGDSRCVGVNKNKTVFMSFDHKPEDREERARIQRAGGYVLEGRVCGSLSLSRAFGDYQYKGIKPEECMVTAIPDISVHERSQLNMLLIACDGIWEGQTDYGEAITLKCMKLVQQKVNGGDILKQLMNQTLAKQLTAETLFGLDNMSCILIKFHPNEKLANKVKQIIKKKIRKNNKK